MVMLSKHCKSILHAIESHWDNKYVHVGLSLHSFYIDSVMSIDRQEQANISMGEDRYMNSLQIGRLYGIKSKAAISLTFDLHGKATATLFLITYYRVDYPVLFISK